MFVGCQAARAALVLGKLASFACGGIWGRTRHLGGAMERQNGEFAWVRVQ